MARKEWGIFVSLNGVGEQLLVAWSLDTAGLGNLSSAVQIGFISGTLLFAISGPADRFSASVVEPPAR